MLFHAWNVSFRLPAWLQIFRNGNLDKPGDYGGPRDGPGIVSYLEKVSGPPSKELKTKEEVRGDVCILHISCRVCKPCNDKHGMHC